MGNVVFVIPVAFTGHLSDEGNIIIQGESKCVFVCVLIVVICMVCFSCVCLFFVDFLFEDVLAERGA